MRLYKSLLAIAAAATLAATTAFAEDSRPIEMIEGEEPALLNQDWGYGEQESMEVTEYYLIVPESEAEMQTNG